MLSYTPDEPKVRAESFSTMIAELCTDSPYEPPNLPMFGYFAEVPSGSAEENPADHGVGSRAQGHSESHAA